MEEGVGGGGHWTHREVIDVQRQRGGKWIKLGLPDTIVIRGDHHRIKMKDQRRRAVSILGAARNRYGVRGGQFYSRLRHVAWK